MRRVVSRSLISGLVVSCSFSAMAQVPQYGALALGQAAVKKEAPLAAKEGVLAAGALQGTVVDASGAPVANAVVTIRNTGTGASWTARSNAQGRYQVAGLPVGVYSVTVSLPGFQVATTNGVQLRAGQATSLNPVLRTDGHDKQVEVHIPKPAPAAPPPPPPPPPPTQAIQIQPQGQKVVPPPVLLPEQAAVAPKPQQQKDAGHNADQVAAEDQAFVDWHKSLPLGLSEHHVDPLMRLGQDSTVTFTIHGPNAPAATPAPADAPQKIQVSPMMSVYLTAPDNPDGFKIANGDSGENPRRVPPDGTATWTWIVTPQTLGPLKLHIDAFVVKDDKGSDEASYQSYDDTIDVKAVTVWGYLTTGFIWILNNPGASLVWILPGGAGAALIGKLIHWLVTRKKKPAAGDAT